MQCNACTVGDDGVIGDLSSESISAHNQGLQTRVQLAATNIDNIGCSMQVLNGLEKMGYRVVSCSNIITGHAKFDTRDMVWTLHKAKEDWETSSK